MEWVLNKGFYEWTDYIIYVWKTRVEAAMICEGQYGGTLF